MGRGLTEEKFRHGRNAYAYGSGLGGFYSQGEAVAAIPALGAAGRVSTRWIVGRAWHCTRDELAAGGGT